MQLGITIPLQKYLKVKQPPYGEPIDLFFAGNCMLYVLWEKEHWLWSMQTIGSL